MQPLYDSIGATYGATRRADPGISEALAEYVGAGRAASFLDVACGTGNYTCALAALGGHWHGIDISSEMLEQAQRRSPRVVWQIGSADALPYSDGAFAGVICTLAIHHFESLEKSFSEVFRVLSGGTFVMVTAFPEQMRNYWLCHYFPEMMARSIEKMPAKAIVLDALLGSGFTIQDVVPLHVTNELQDMFLYSGKGRPELYLNSCVRANISSFATLCPTAELEDGLHALRSDIEDDRFPGIVQRYSESTGDYAYGVAHKQTANPPMQRTVTSGLRPPVPAADGHRYARMSHIGKC